MLNLFSKFKKPLTIFGFAIGAALLLGACNKNDNYVENPVSRLMAFNLVPDQDGIGISLSGNPLVNGPMSFTNFTGNYLNIFPGQRLVESFSYPRGEGLDSVNFIFEPNQFYSLFVVGADSLYENILVKDNYDSLKPLSGKAFLRFVAAVPGVDNSTVLISGNGNDYSGSLAFGDVAEFQTVNAGSLTVAFENESFSSPSREITLEENNAYTVLLTGLSGQASGEQAVQIRYILNGRITE